VSLVSLVSLGRSGPGSRSGFFETRRTGFVSAARSDCVIGRAGRKSGDASLYLGKKDLREGPDGRRPVGKEAP